MQVNNDGTEHLMSSEENVGGLMDSIKNLHQKRCLYLDDVRTPKLSPPGYRNWDIVRDYDEFVTYIEKNGLPDLISFDHDLGIEHMEDYFKQVAAMGWQAPNYESYKDKTGLDCAKWMCDYIKDNNIHEVPLCTVHSHNPVGSDNIESYIKGFYKHCSFDQQCYKQQHPFTTG